jgi:hypothetical protein
VWGADLAQANADEVKAAAADRALSRANAGLFE